MHLNAIREDMGFGSTSDPVEANYLPVEYDDFVDSLLSFCVNRQ